jgi:hypothetical protein
VRLEPVERDAWRTWAAEEKSHGTVKKQINMETSTATKKLKLDGDVKQRRGYADQENIKPEEPKRHAGIDFLRRCELPMEIALHRHSFYEKEN